MQTNIHDTIRDVIARCDCKINYTLENRKNDDTSSINAKYDQDRNLIILYEKSILESCIYYSGDCLLEEYYELILCHEIGHRNDVNLRENNILRFKIIEEFKDYCSRKESLSAQEYTRADEIMEEYLKKTIDIETAAFENGKKYVSPHLYELYDKIQEKNIKNVEENFFAITSLI